MLKRAIMVALGVVLALAVAMPVAFGQVGQGAVASGAAKELAADWWSWAASKPMAKNPMIGSYTKPDSRCNGNPVTEVRGKKWFLAGYAGELPGIQPTPAAVRSCNVPKGTQLFFPVVNNVLSKGVLEDGENAEQLRANAKALTDDMLQGDSSWYVKVDGENVKAKRIIRAQSAPFMLYFHPKNPFADFGYVGKKVSVGDGLWVTLPPLSSGELHTIKFGGEFVLGEETPSPDDNFTFTQDIVYKVRVK